MSDETASNIQARWNGNNSCREGRGGPLSIETLWNKKCRIRHRRQSDETSKLYIDRIATRFATTGNLRCRSPLLTTYGSTHVPAQQSALADNVIQTRCSYQIFGLNSIPNPSSFTSLVLSFRPLLSCVLIRSLRSPLLRSVIES